MRSKSWLEKKDEMLQTEKKHYEEYRGCNEYHTEHIVAGLNSFLELIELFFERFWLKFRGSPAFRKLVMKEGFLPLFKPANDLLLRALEVFGYPPDSKSVWWSLMMIFGYHNGRVIRGNSHNEFEWKSTIDERIPQARGSFEIRQCWEGCNATEALFTSQLNYFLRLI